MVQVKAHRDGGRHGVPCPGPPPHILMVYGQCIGHVLEVLRGWGVWGGRGGVQSCAGGSIVPDTAGGHRRSVGWDSFLGVPSVRRVCPMR